MFSGVSNITSIVDNIFLVFLIICVALFVLIVFLMVFFVIKYHQKRNPTPQQIEGNVLLEIVWTIIPAILVLGMFYYSWTGYRIMKNPPEDAMVVKVTGSMWQWNFEYDNVKPSDVLRIPVDKPIRLAITSLDVLHSFYVPAFRVKEDAVPGLETSVWFEPRETGTYDVLCAEFCGLNHAYMQSKVIVMSESAFTEWYQNEDRSPANAGSTTEGSTTTEPAEHSDT